MRIAYFVPFRGGRETGIHRKVAEHASEWTRLGATVGLFVATGEAAVDDWHALPSTVRVEVLPVHPAATVVARERLQHAIRSWKPDVVYARHGLVHPGILWTAIRRPLVIEVNSNEVTEFATTSPWRSRWSQMTRELLLARTAGLVFISGELARSRDYDRGHAARIAIGNGIRLSDLPPYDAPCNAQPRLVFIGHADSPWHGLDLLVEMANAFPGWRFDVIGPGSDEVVAAPANLHAHGTLRPDSYQDAMSLADVAVGSLGLYRNQMLEGSPLKVREYLARGLPTIIGYRDTDFPDPPPFLLEIPDEPTGVASSLDRIADFVARAPHLRVPREAIAHLDVGVKEVQRLDFIEQVARAR